jgi:hypothetical protein
MRTQILAGTIGSGLHHLKIALKDIHIQHQTGRVELRLAFHCGRHPDSFCSNITINFKSFTCEGKKGASILYFYFQ